MRRLSFLFAIALAGCGAAAKSSTTPSAPPITPADDLERAKTDVPRADPSDSSLVAKDPRVVDLDIIRIRAGSGGPGREPELTSVASADLFRAANEAAKAGTTQDAIARYRQLLAEFPESLYAPISLFNIAAVHDSRGDVGQTIATLRELVTAYPTSRESIEGHLYIAALQSDKAQWADAQTTLDEVLLRGNLTFADRVEAHARRGHVLVEQRKLDEAEPALAAALAEWRKAPRIEDVYYVAMAHYYRGEVAHQRFLAHALRAGDDEMAADLEQKRVFAVQAYDRWLEALRFRHAYWATASGYQMSQIFVELWEAHIKAPVPRRIEASQRKNYLAQLHDNVKVHLTKALEGHRKNVELAQAYGVDTSWSQASARQAGWIMDTLAKEATGTYDDPAAVRPN